MKKILIVKKSNCDGSVIVLMTEKKYNENIKNINKSKIEHLNYTFEKIEEIEFLDTVEVYKYLINKYKIKSNEYKKFLFDNKIVTHLTNKQLIEINKLHKKELKQEVNNEF